MTKTFCDMCGKKFINPAEQAWMRVSFPIDSRVDTDTRLAFKNMLYICPDCLKAIAKTIHN